MMYSPGTRAGDHDAVFARRARTLMQAEAGLGLWRRATMIGLESVPASAFDKAVYDDCVARPSRPVSDGVAMSLGQTERAEPIVVMGW